MILPDRLESLDECRVEVVEVDTNLGFGLTQRVRNSLQPPSVEEVLFLHPCLQER